MSSSGTGSPPWSHLPAELLELISSKIAEIVDFIQFRSVCKSWRSAAYPSNLFPQLPWLLLPYDPTNTIRSFFSFSTRSIHTLHLPQTLNHIIYGSSNGWLLLLDKTLSISLFNPITKSLIPLPQITNLPQTFSSWFIRSGDSCIRHDPQSKSNHLLTLARIPSFFTCYAFVSPNLEGGVVAFLLDGCPLIHYWRPGDDKWTTIHSCLDGFFQAMAFHKGKLYIVDLARSTAVCDFGSNGSCKVVPHLQLPGFMFSNYYLVSTGQELLLAIQDTDDCRSFVYYKLDENEEGWRRLYGVWNSSVFLTVGPSVSWGKLMHVVSDAREDGRKGLCCAIPGERTDRNGHQLSRLDVVLIGDEYQELYGSWETHRQNLMTSSWIIPGLS